MRWCLDAAHLGANAKCPLKSRPFCDDYLAMTERYIIPMTAAIAEELANQHKAKCLAPDDTIKTSLSRRGVARWKCVIGCGGNTAHPVTRG